MKTFWLFTLLLFFVPNNAHKHLVVNGKEVPQFDEQGNISPRYIDALATQQLEKKNKDDLEYEKSSMEHLDHVIQDFLKNHENQLSQIQREHIKKRQEELRPLQIKNPAKYALEILKDIDKDIKLKKDLTSYNLSDLRKKINKDRRRIIVKHFRKKAWKEGSFWDKIGIVFKRCVETVWYFNNSDIPYDLQGYCKKQSDIV